jgi:peptidoglycan/LPS O-acetylase OafA/YrhL
MIRIPQLDGLRGMAIGMVLVYHYSTLPVGLKAPTFCRPLLMLSGGFGWSGVDLFFVLSGFLIGGILLEARNSANYFQVFFARRIFRIFPLYFAFLTVFFAGSIFFQSRVFEQRIPWEVFATFSQNIWMATHDSFGTGFLGPLWSLAVEEQFYLILPLLIYFVPGRALAWILGSGIAAAVAIRLAIAILFPSNTVAAYVLLPCRMDALLLGVAAAYLVQQRGLAWLALHKQHLWTAVEICMLLCIFFLLKFSWEGPARRIVGYTLFDLLYCSILLTCLVDESLAAVLSVRWLTGLGSIAYCTYLIHEVVLMSVSAALRTQNWLLIIAASFTITIMFATISWKWFEKRIIKLGHQFSFQKSKPREQRENHVLPVPPLTIEYVLPFL